MIEIVLVIVLVIVIEPRTEFDIENEVVTLTQSLLLQPIDLCLSTPPLPSIFWAKTVLPQQITRSAI